jgi:hypothetical protein
MMIYFNIPGVPYIGIGINDNLTEQVTDFKYLGYRISEYRSDLEHKLQTYNKTNGAVRRHFGEKNEQRKKIKNSQHYS